MKTRALTALLALVLAALPAFVAAQASPVPVQPVASAADQILLELTRQLSERYQVRGELQLEWARAFGSSLAAPVDLVVLSAPAKPASSMLLQVRLVAGGKNLGEHTLSVRAQLLRDAWVPRTPTERGTDVDLTQLDIRLVDVLQQRDVVTLEDVEKTELTYAVSVPSGRVLTWRDVTRRALVRKGQVVDVTASDGALTITTKALALENGAAGDTVKLRNIESKKDFSALVVASARAQVRF